MIDLKSTYEKASALDLVRITMTPHAYTPEALEIAHQQLQLRALDPTVINELKDEILQEQQVRHIEIIRKKSTYKSFQDRLQGFIGVVNPVQPTLATLKWKISITVILLLYITGQIWSSSASDLPYLIPYLFRVFDLYVLLVVAQILLLPLATVGFALRKRAGWVLTVAVIGLQLLFDGLALASAIDYHYLSETTPSFNDNPGGGLLDLVEIYAPPDPIASVPSLFLYIALLYIINQTDVLLTYSVTVRMQIRVYLTVSLIALSYGCYTYLS